MKILIATLLCLFVTATAAAQDAPTVYLFDREGIYRGAEAPPESPLEPGVYLDPARSTRTAPPTARDGFALKWDGESWGYVEDHGGKTVYLKTNGAGVTLTNNPDDGDGYSYGPIPDAYTVTEKPGEFYEWDAEQSAWVENTAAKQEAADKIAAIRALAEDVDTKAIEDKLSTATPAQIEAYVADKFKGITDLASAKQVISKLFVELLKREAALAQKADAE